MNIFFFSRFWFTWANMLMIIPFYAILRSKFNLVLVSSRYYHDDSKETTNKLFFVSHEIPGKLWRCKIIEYENWAPSINCKCKASIFVFKSKRCIKICEGQSNEQKGRHVVPVRRGFLTSWNTRWPYPSRFLLLEAAF